MKIIPYSRQSIDKSDILAVQKSLSGDFLTQGYIQSQFEKQIAKRLKCKYALVCSSATAGLHMINSLFKKKRFAVSPLTFASTVSTIILSKNTPVFTDISKHTLLIDPNKIKKNKIDGIINVLFAGSSSNSIELRKKFKNKIIIEDASHALGGQYEDDSMIGSCKYSDFSVFSLHPVKSITSGEGGIITTNSKNFYEKLKLLRSHGILRKKDISKNSKFVSKNNETKKLWYYEINSIGFNYRMNEIQCALGLSQFRKLNKFIAKRRKISKLYDNLFKKNENIEIPQKDILTRSKSSHHLYTIRVISKKINRDKLQRKLLKYGIESQVHYIPAYNFNAFKKNVNKGNYKNTEYHFSRCLSIPNFYNLDLDKVKKISFIINNLTK